MTRIGICEDDPGLRSVLTRALADEGFEVRAAAGGRVAVQEFSAAPPDLACWTIWSAGTPRDFWIRRQLHETVVHCVDAVGSLLNAYGRIATTYSAKNPSKKPRSNINSPSLHHGIPFSIRLVKANGNAAPIENRKNGNTRSTHVMPGSAPFHWPAKLAIRMTASGAR